MPSHVRLALIEARKQRGWSQQEVADRLGTTRLTISRWEHGSTTPGPYWRTKLGDLFGQPPQVLGVVSEPAVTEQMAAPRLTLDTSPPFPLVSAQYVPLHTVPYPRNPFFTGREEILQHVHAHLGTGTSQSSACLYPYALHGLAGIGKTQIALEYAYRFARDYRAVFWIEAETIERIIASFMRIAECLQVPERRDADQQRVIAAVQHWLQVSSDWLLIWDNLEALDLLHHFLPPMGQGAVLLTTRNQALSISILKIAVAPMEREEGVLFLMRRANILGSPATREQVQQLAGKLSDEHAAADAVYTTLGGLPLALDQAGAYIDETGCSLDDYLQRYNQQCMLLLDRRGSVTSDHPHSVMATFRLAWEQVEREQGVAADLLRICALLSADAIPEELFLTGAIWSC